MPMKMETSLRGLEALAIWIVAVFVFVPEYIVGLKDVSVTIPQAVRRGGNALFICNYDLENDTLYSVKWYKGRREFYRYTPKENPAMKTFPSPGINVEGHRKHSKYSVLYRNLSNQSHVVLLAVPLSISGKFTCEISVDAPSFLTAMVSSEMEVVELPEQRPIVTGIHSRYRLGDLVDGNCSIKFSKPAANLTWTINGVVVPPHHIKMHQIEKYPEHNLESVYSEIGFMVTTQHFIKGQMRLKCTALIFNIYKEEVEKLVEEDRPRIMESGRPFDMNAYPYDQQSSGDFEDHNESYLTYYSAADVSSSATSIFSTSRKRLTAGRLVSQLHRLVVSTSSASLSSITNVSRQLLKGQIENAETLARIFYFIVIAVAATPATTIVTTTAAVPTTASASTMTPSMPEDHHQHHHHHHEHHQHQQQQQHHHQSNNTTAKAYATMIMFTVAVIVVAVVLVVLVIFFVRWRFNDFLPTEKGYYHSPGRHRHHHHSDNEIDTNRVLSSPGQREEHQHQHRYGHCQCCSHHHRHRHHHSYHKQKYQAELGQYQHFHQQSNDSHQLLLLPMATLWVEYDTARIKWHVESLDQDNCYFECSCSCFCSCLSSIRC